MLHAMKITHKLHVSHAMQSKTGGIMKKNIVLFLVFVSGLFVLNACLDQADPVKVATHPDDWINKSSENFHGKVLLSESLRMESCQSCHGEDYQGGTSEVSCYNSSCHAIYPHPEGFANPSSANFHEGMMSLLNWDLESCQSCHGADYAGNNDRAKNCLSCHKAENGPEACNTCHGNKENAAPPKDLMNHSDVDYVTVGAHQAHLENGTWSTFNMGDCSTCHKTPAMFSSSGHIDDSPHAEIVFNSLASFDGKSNVQWDREDATCSNTYCHGAFEFKKEESTYPWAYTADVMKGNYKQVYWPVSGSIQDACGSCHGLPPEGHVSATDCSGCHSRVVDENFNIINKFLHINGKIDVFN